MMNLTDRVKSMAHGAVVLAQWTVDGIVVEPEKAQARADVCTGRLSGKPCPNNVDGWEFAEQISRTIRKIVELKNGLELKVQGEKSLHTCSACECDLKSKVWKELKSILPEPQERVKFVEQCWILKEKP